MGKYNIVKSSPSNDKEWLLEKIANELAEANRLKRIEIQINTESGFGHSGRGTGSWIVEKDVVNKELEDQA